jgi:flagellar biosynthesis protein FlhG
VLSLKHDTRRFRLLVNMATDPGEAEDVHRQLTMVANRFLNIEIDYLGFIPRDPNVVRGVKYQQAVRDLFPHSPASKSFSRIAKIVARRAVSAHSDEGRGLFRNSLNGGVGE